MAAVEAVRNDRVESITTGWLITVARRRLVDHWRRQEVERRHLASLESDDDGILDDWDEHLDVFRTQAALRQLRPIDRAVLTLRYLDGLPVADVAELVGR